jgi:hypothetical protein
MHIFLQMGVGAKRLFLNLGLILQLCSFHLNYIKKSLLVSSRLPACGLAFMTSKTSRLWHPLAGAAQDLLFTRSYVGHVQ